MLQVSSQLSQAITALPTDATNDLPYMALIERFGTHYANTITMGAKFVYQSEVWSQKVIRVIIHFVNFSHPNM